MKVVANGKAIDLPDGATVLDLIDRLGLGARWVAVERNGRPVKRAEFGVLSLCAGDRLEVVKPVQGG